ncbi:MAG: PD40 domain-containing protein, partial [Acidobacteria bacterium]|nr:PD40 domain-containing protein [Acidobacteriota bacterium]
GTAAYMSPEQAKGKSVDKRADIWAFGCILYECLSGKKVFEGEMVTEMLAAVLRGDPDWNTLPSTTPQNIRFVLRRCLVKERNRRFHCIADLRILMDEMREINEATTPVKSTWSKWILVSTTSLLAIALMVFAFLYFHGAAPSEAMHYHVSVPPLVNDHSFAISPDGSRITFAASSAGANSLFVCKIGSVTPEPLDGTEGAEYPFWSPDSRSIAFFAKGRLMQVDATGGSPRLICPARGIFNGTWNRDGIIIFSEGEELRQVSADGGESATLTTLDEFQNAHVFPHFLPNGVHYLYTAFANEPSKNGIFLGSLDSEKKMQLLTATVSAAYVDPGYLLFQRERALYAQPFDVKKLESMGEAIRIADNLILDVRIGISPFDASQNGVLIYRTGNMQAKSQFIWFDKTGNQIGLAGAPGMYSPDFDLSPDEKQIAMKLIDISGSRANIYLMDWERDIREQLTNNPSANIHPHWSADGQRIAFASYRKGDSELFEKKVGSIEAETELLVSSENEQTPSWSKDDRHIAFGKVMGSDIDIYALPLFGEKKPFPIIQLPGNEHNFEFSYDNKWLAYQSDESGINQVYLISFPDPEAQPKRQISNNGGVQPQWREDGKELYYLALDGKIMAVEITTDTGIDIGASRELIDTSMIVLPSDQRQYAATRDGQRFLVLKPLTEAASTPITITFNWTSLLNKQ